MNIVKFLRKPILRNICERLRLISYKVKKADCIQAAFN